MSKLLAVCLAIAVGAAFWIVESYRDTQADLEEAQALGEIQTATNAVKIELAELLAYEAIAATEHKYDRGLDRHDEALISEVFWPDAALIYGARVPVSELPTWANDIHAQAAAHKHHVTSMAVDREGDQAHLEIDLLFSSNVPRDKALDQAGTPTPGRVPQGAVATFGSGRYINRYEQRDGQWRVAVHEYVQDVSMVLNVVDLCATACIGRWDASDISYLRPLLPLSADERTERAQQGTVPRARLSSSEQQ